MTAIVGYSDLLRLKKCDEETSRKAIRYIYSEAKRLEKLSFKLMKLMSISEENIVFNNFEIKDFIQKVVNSESFILTENTIELDIERANIKGDKELLEVVIRNLIENSNKANPKDKKILVKGKRMKNNKYRIFIIDKGRGIPKEHIERITDDFYMVDKSRTNGSGIGLSLVKKILNFHNTDIYIESEENVGTMVHFDLQEAEK